MDGERKECPIEPDKAIRYLYGEGEDDFLLIAPSHDSIQMFPDSRYNHVRYFDATEGQMRMIWLPHEVLADLYDMGIPHTKRESITESEYEGYVTYLGRVSASTELELEVVPELTAGDPIDAEVQQHMQKFDQEAEFYLYHEWGSSEES